MIYHTNTRRRVVTTIGGLAVAIPGLSAAQPPDQRNFRTHLSGDEEVPPVDTNAHGQANFQLKDEDELRFKLIVANIENVVAAHIHCASAGDNGPVGVTLFGGGPTSQNGVLAQGTITEPDAENGCGWTSLDDVVGGMRSGDTYVNVHTTQNSAGEIRGQIH